VGVFFQQTGATVDKLKFFVSLMTAENDYQLEQAHAAEMTAHRLGVSAEIVYAENDSITQSTQILKRVQSAIGDRPHAVIFEPVGGTALPQVARAAIAAGIGWAVLSRDAAYVSELRASTLAPIFGVSSDQVEVGRISGKQCAALLPRGGSILYIEGPSQSEAAREREIGIHETLPPSIHLTVLKGQWTEESATRAVSSWLKLSTSQKAAIDLVVAQNDAMAIGARKAFQEILSPQDRERWTAIPLLGCDGVPKTGQSWVRSGLLTSTILIPPNAGQAIELMAEALLNRKMPIARAFAPVVSIPPIESLRPLKPF
jgi:ribose transport system substrate-binding protein